MWKENSFCNMHFAKTTKKTEKTMFCEFPDIKFSFYQILSYELQKMYNSLKQIKLVSFKNIDIWP